MDTMLFLLLVTILAVAADECQTCVNGGKQWCADIGASGQCAASLNNCNTVIEILDNCPHYPDPAYAYDDAWARRVILPLIGAVINMDDPLPCLKSQLPTATLYKSIRVPCQGPGAFCHAFAAYDTTAKTIMVSFRGAHGNMQKIDAMTSSMLKKKAFFNYGNVYSYIYTAFYDLWNGGLEQSVRNLQYLYPDYSLVATGHSLGASVCTLFVSQIVKVNLWQPKNIKVVTLGEARTGDQNFSMWHDSTFPFAYRVVHAADPVPHTPKMSGPDEGFHYRYEVWYDNDMSIGSNYTICPEADGPYCSSSKPEKNGDDHMLYYNKDLHVWPEAGCPKD